EVISYETGGSYTFKGKIPYKDAMLKSELILKSTVSIKGKDAIPLPDAKIADGVIATATLLQNEALAIESMNQFQRRQVISAESKINFLINQAVVRGNELTKEDMKNMKKFIADAEKDPNIELKNTQVIGYASPEGPEAHNQSLAESRQTAAQKAIARDVKVEMLGTAAGEDWDGFRQLMQASDIENKEIILSVLSKYSDGATREAEIKKMAAVYSQIAKEILPELRRSRIVVNAEKQGKSDSLIIALATANELTGDTLSIEEYLFAATIAKDQDEAAVMLTNASKIYPDNWRMFNN